MIRKRTITIITTIFFGVGYSMMSFGQTTNLLYKLEETDGFCYGTYSNNDKEYKLYYDRPNMSKTLFHFNDSERKYLILFSKRYSPTGMNNRILVFDTRNNIVREIDSCYDNNKKHNCKVYLATSGDTIYAAYPDRSTIEAFLFSENKMSKNPVGQKNEFLKRIASLSDVNSWCVSKNNSKLAYKRDKEDSINIIFKTDSVRIPSGFAEVIAWRDESHLLYVKINVEGMGDFYYDLYEYDIEYKKNHLIFEGLYDVYDYYDNCLLYLTSDNKLTMIRFNGDESEIINQIDLSMQMEWIYCAYIINDMEIIIGGDKRQSDCHYFKCKSSISEK